MKTARRYVAAMDTGGHKYRVRHLFLKEHREAKGMSAEDMGRKLGIERESVYRLEREAFTRLNPEKQVAYAKALNIAPQDLWRPPGHPSLDGMVAHSPEDVQALAADIVRRLVMKTAEQNRIENGWQCPECFGPWIETRQSPFGGPSEDRFECQDCGCTWLRAAIAKAEGTS